MWFSLVGCLLNCLRTRRSALITCVHSSVHPSLDRGLSLAISVESSTALVRVSIILIIVISIWSYDRTRGTSGRSWSTLWKISLFIFLKSRLVGSSSRPSRYPNTVSTGRWSEPLFDIARQIVYPPRLPLYRFSLSRIPVKLSSNPLKSPRQPYVAINSSNLMLAYLAFACDTSFS
jgi:hypothetical protein